jgi:hypothetical protein
LKGERVYNLYPSRQEAPVAVPRTWSRRADGCHDPKDMRFTSTELLQYDPPTAAWLIPATIYSMDLGPISEIRWLPI